MKVLIVEDEQLKRNQVATFLREPGRFTEMLEVYEANDYEQALTALRQSYFDLVVLDLLLPAARQPPSADTSRAIIESVLQGTESIPPAHIIGLTAHSEVAEDEELFYDENLFALELYDPVNLDWQKRLAAKIQYLLNSKLAAASFRLNSFDLDIFVLTARYENEFQPVCAALLDTIDAKQHPQWPGLIHFGTVANGSGRTLRAAICCVKEMGMAPAAAVASQAIAMFRPRLVSMIGMCCGFNTATTSSAQKMMDVIVAREVDCWEEGKYVDIVKDGAPWEFRNRSKGRVVDDLIREHVESTVEMEVDLIRPALARFAKTKQFKAIREHFGEELMRAIPGVKFAPITSGSSVIAEERMVEEILTRNPKAVGLDMELYGVYSAAEKCAGKRPSVLGVKGVADHGQVVKDDAAQQAASKAATIVFRSILPHLPIWS